MVNVIIVKIVLHENHIYGKHYQNWNLCN